MNRMTRWDPVCHCYKAVREQEMGRSVIQELGVYESIHEKEIEKAVNIGDIRDMYFTGAAQLDPYWENFGKEKDAPDNWIPVTDRLPKNDEDVLVCYPNGGMEVVYYHIDNSIYPTEYKDSNETGWCNEEGDAIYFEPVAWMPLPEPYKAESEEV